MTKSKQDQNSNHKLTVFESIIIGSVANSTEAVINYPLFTLKNRVQDGAKFTMNPRILYTGVIPYMVGTAPITSMQMGVNQGIKNIFLDRSITPSNYQQSASAFAAGAISALVACPTEMVVTQQNKLGGKFFSIGTHLIKQRGWSCLVIGMPNIAIRDGIFTMGYAVGGPSIKSKIRPYCRNDFEASVLSGISAGVPAAIASQANDTIKTVQQIADQLQPIRAVEAAEKIYATKGFSGFLKGGFWRGARVVTAITIIGTVKEKMEAECNSISSRI